MFSAVLVESRVHSGKLNQPNRTETIDLGPSDSKRLHIRDVSTGLVYLIDTGSDISLLPADSKTLKQKPNDLVLFAANDSRVPTYGEWNVTLNIILRHVIRWNSASLQYLILS